MIWHCPCGEANSLQRGFCRGCGRPGRGQFRLVRQPAWIGRPVLRQVEVFGEPAAVHGVEFQNGLGRFYEVRGLEALGRASDAAVLAIPPAVGGPAPAWPLPGYRKFSRQSFGGNRPWNSPNPERYHAGVDIHCPRGSVVVAAEDGTVVRSQGWRSRKGFPDRTTKALLLQLDTGPVLVYGALIPDSWRAYGVSVGSRVRRGQPLGQVGTYPNGDTMLHFEARKQGATKADPWYVSDDSPSNLLNVTPYLEQAAKNADEIAEPSDPVLNPEVPTSIERWIQLMLRQSVAPELDVDGQIGPATRAALRKFQIASGLKPDGIAGPKTMAALKARFGEPPWWTEGDLGDLGQRLKDAFTNALKEVFG